MRHRPSPQGLQLTAHLPKRAQHLLSELLIHLQEGPLPRTDVLPQLCVLVRCCRQSFSITASGSSCTAVLELDLLAAAGGSRERLPRVVLQEGFRFALALILLPGAESWKFENVQIFAA